MRSADTRLSGGRDAPTSAAELLADSSSASPQNNLSTDLGQPHVSQIYNTDDSDGAGLKHSKYRMLTFMKPGIGNCSVHRFIRDYPHLQSKGEEWILVGLKLDYWVRELRPLPHR